MGEKLTMKCKTENTYRVTLTEEMLGTACANPDVHKEFIASKSADAEKMKEELEALSAADLEAKGKTIFPRDDDGTPFLWDYQIRGFLKESLGIMCDIEEPDVKVGKTKVSKYSHKKIVDNFVFVKPRKIRLSVGVGKDCVRPLRAETMKGERVSLATSETVPAGATLEFSIELAAGGHDFEELIEKCLAYGQLKGLGAWRNSGKGRFDAERLDAPVK